MDLSALASDYIRKFGFFKKAQIGTEPSPDLRVSVVIPAYFEDLSDTLQSLSMCKVQQPAQFEVIMVLNHSEKAPQHIREYHEKQFKQKVTQLENGIPVYWIPAFELPAKHSGVGLARKIGMDEALLRFEKSGHNGLIVCLDGDCTVSVNYLQSLLEAEKIGYNGLSIYYEHPLQKEEGEVLDAIVDYEIFLRYYSLGLRETGYPFYFQTVGSSMAARASAYIKAGGMNKRKAGEDFYFLHRIFPQGRFTHWPHCTVYPSARSSERVPFGTGKAMIACLEGQKDYSRVYNPRLFEELKNWFGDLPAIYNIKEEEWPPGVLSFLENNNCKNELRDLTLRSNDALQFRRNFYFWMDGFRIMKFLNGNHQDFRDQKHTEACAQLLGTNASDARELITELRRVEKERPVTYL
ncbi:MAG: glycosyltransferase [Owenweeksia sp.]